MCAHANKELCLQVIERRESVMMQEDSFTLEQPASSRKPGSEFLQEANRFVASISHFFTTHSFYGRKAHLPKLGRSLKIGMRTFSKKEKNIISLLFLLSLAFLTNIPMAVVQIMKVSTLDDWLGLFEVPIPVPNDLA